MTDISAPLKNLKPSEPPAQVIEEDKKAWKEEHKVIYDAFLAQLETHENLDKKTLDNYKDIFHNVNPEDIEPLSEENFLQFLLSVLEKIREKNLASGKNSKNDEIKQEVAECIADIRGTEAKDSLIKLLGWPLGIKINPKDIFASVKDGLLGKVPFFGKGNKEENEPPLSDEEMVTTFLRKSLFPIILFSLPALIFGTGPIMLGIAVVGLLITEAKVIKSLFSNDKKGTLYNPHSQSNENDAEKRAELDGKILDGISEILGAEVEGAGKGEQLISVPEVTQSSGSKQRPNSAFKQATVDPVGQNAQVAGPTTTAR